MKIWSHECNFFIQIIENTLEKTSLQVYLCFLHTHKKTQRHTYTLILRITHICYCVYIDMHKYIHTHIHRTLRMKPVAN